jgi:cytochrome c553
MRRTMLALLVVLGMFAVGTSALAYPSFPAAVVGQYPNATRLNTCGTCHNDFSGPSAGLNPYGTAFLNADGLTDPAAAMTAIEGNDSDGDGSTNVQEMTTGAGFLPGWTCDTAASASNPPTNILDFVDPANIGCTGATTTTVPVTTTLPPATTTTTGATTTTTTGVTTTTTVPGEPKCSQPVTNGPDPTASDCLFILRSAVGSSTCDPTCICNVNAAGGITATDALICLKKAVGQNVELACQCSIVTTTTTTLPPPTSTTTTVTTSTTVTTTSSTTSTTTGGGSIAAGQALYDNACAFCHAAGSHDTSAEMASDLAHDGNKLVLDLSTIDDSMNILLTEQQLQDLAAFLDSLPLSAVVIRR